MLAGGKEMEKEEARRRGEERVGERTHTCLILMREGGSDFSFTDMHTHTCEREFESECRRCKSPCEGDFLSQERRERGRHVRQRKTNLFEREGEDGDGSNFPSMCMGGAQGRALSAHTWCTLGEYSTTCRAGSLWHAVICGDKH